MRINRIVSVSLVALSLAATKLAGQVPVLQCVEPLGCVRPTRKPQEIVIVKLTGTLDQIAGQTVYFRASTGKMSVDSAKTDHGGIAVAVWNGDPSNRAARITIAAVVDNILLPAEIVLGTPARLAPVAGTPRARWYHDWGLFSRDQEWYEKRQLKRQVSVDIDTSLGQCTENAVVFESYGKDSDAKPDTAFGSLYFRGGQPRCEANAFWLLGEGVGRHLLRATLLNDPQQRIEFVAKSRALPWVGLGLAVANSSAYVGLSSEERVVKVTRRFQTTPGGDSLEVSYDSTAKVTAPDSVKAQAQMAPVIGVNFPLVLRAEWLRFYLGADLKNPRSDWYMGISLLQMTAGWQHESVGYDVDIVAHLSQRKVVKNAPCAPAVCMIQTETGFVGVGAVVTVSTASVLDKLFTALGVK